MNREIKFEYGFESVNGIVKKIYYLHEIPNIKELCDVWGTMPIKYVRQFIGMTKNGKEIYCGDIVNVRGTKRHGDYVTSIIYSRQGFTLQNNKTYLKDDRCFIAIIGVIGNIYENPELL